MNDNERIFVQDENDLVLDSDEVYSIIEDLQKKEKKAKLKHAFNHVKDFFVITFETFAFGSVVIVILSLLFGITTHDYKGSLIMFSELALVISIFVTMFVIFDDINKNKDEIRRNRISVLYQENEAKKRRLENEKEGTTNENS